MPTSISLIRHGEKQIGDALPQGISVDGTPDPNSLTPRGWQRAGALVGLFVERSPGGAPPLLPTPDHLFASEVGPHSQSRRPAETLLPIAERLGITIAEPFLQDQLDELAAAECVPDGVHRDEPSHGRDVQPRAVRHPLDAGGDWHLAPPSLLFWFAFAGGRPIRNASSDTRRIHHAKWLRRRAG